MLKIGYNDSKNHWGSDSHYEKPDRIHMCVDKLKESLPEETFIVNNVSKTTSLKLVLNTHTSSYVESLINCVPQNYICRKCKNKMESEKLTFHDFIEEFKKCRTCDQLITVDDIYCYLDADTYFTNNTFDIVLQGVGVLKALIDDIKTGTQYGFALIRPPGHHCNNKGSGFCVVNNVVIASKYAQSIGYKKVFILDIDFHHGDGTQTLIKDVEDIYFCSLHGYGKYIYPGTGSRDENNDKILNIPINVTIHNTSRHYVNDDYYLGIIEGEVKEFTDKFNPDIIIISCGFDGHCEDPLEGLNLTDDAYVRIVNNLKTYGVPLLFVTEGGYNVSTIARTVKKMTYAMM